MLALQSWLMRSRFLAVGLLICLASFAQGQIRHPEANLASIFPAGGQRGSQVTVDVWGVGIHSGDVKLLIDGPGGVEVSELKVVHDGRLQARLTIAPDAPLGRRLVRVHNLEYGKTNFRYFFVGELPEEVEVETENNNTVEKAQAVQTPSVVNGRIYESLDTDWYAFDAQAAQPLVAAVLAHGMDGFLEYKQGYLDTNLVLQDSTGRVLATGDDELGLDPLIHYTVPADGRYYLQVRSLGFRGSMHASYRLTLGAVPYPVAAFPAGGRAGETVKVQILGPNVPPGTTQQVTFEKVGPNPVQQLLPSVASHNGGELTLARDKHPERIEQEPNDGAEQAEPLTLPIIVNGQFLQSGDEDWYQLTLTKGQGVLLQTRAQRDLRSPVDTMITIFGSEGKQVAENDDGAAFAKTVQCAHDFDSSDSFLMFTPPADGEYRVRVSNVSAAAGPEAVYRLSVQPLEPDFLVYQWPGEVPVWGPGTSSTFVVEVMKWGGLNTDINVSVEGLPDGWQGSVTTWPQSWYPHFNGNYAMKLLLTVTAPSDAKVGATATLKVVGRAEYEGRKIEHEAHYMTLYGNSHSDRMQVRYSPRSEAVVADYREDVWIDSDVTQISGLQGEAVKLPVRIHRREGAKQVDSPVVLVANGPTPSAGCAWTSPVTIPSGATEHVIEMKLENREPGKYGIVVSRGWPSDLRAGRPGPCTRLIQLTIEPVEK